MHGLWNRAPLVRTEELSRLRIVGPLGSETPTAVVLEVAEAHGVRYDEEAVRDPAYISSLCTRINELKVISVPFVLKSEQPFQEPRDASDYPLLARYLNKNCTWSRRSLLEAWSFLRSWHRGKVPDLRDWNIPVGPLTSETPRSLNACLLYRLCREAGVETRRETTITHMSRILHLRELGPEALLISVRTLLQGHPTLTPESLRNLLFHATSSSTPSPHSLHSALETEQGALKNPTALRKRVVPNSAIEAIALGASVYGLDLTVTENPIRTYIELRSGVDITDSRVRELWRKNATLLHLETSFNPLFPSSYYSRTALQKMARREGYGAEDLSRSDPYQLLQESHVTNTFHAWKDLPLTKAALVSSGVRVQTIFTLETLEECPPDELLYYGSLDLTHGSLFLTTYQEMENRLQTSQNFKDPFLQEGLFSERAMTKLAILSLETNHKEVEAWIRCIRRTEKVRNEKLRNFSQEYHRTRHKIVLEGLDILLRMAMVMRGWTGTGPYPIKYCPSDPDEIRNSLLLTSLIADLERKDLEIATLNPRLSILSLPLLRYREGRYELGNEDQGLTIGDRLRIVKDDRTITSCIRMSSNWFASSAFKYMKLANLPPPFPISQLEHIS